MSPRTRTLLSPGLFVPAAWGWARPDGFMVKMGMGLGPGPGPGLGPGPMASSPIPGVMSRPISLRCNGFDGSLGIMSRPKYFSIILNHKYYEHF